MEALKLHTKWMLIVLIVELQTHPSPAEIRTRMSPGPDQGHTQATWMVLALKGMEILNLSTNIFKKLFCAWNSVNSPLVGCFLTQS